MQERPEPLPLTLRVIYASGVSLSVAIITFNEAQNLRRTLESLRGIAQEIIIVDNGSTDGTLDIAREFGAQVFCEEWKGYAAQKNSAIEKATGDWILSLDADEAASDELQEELKTILCSRAPDTLNGYWIPRKNYFMGRWIRRGGFYPDRKLRLFRRGLGHFEERPVHETMHVEGKTGTLRGSLLHNAYPTLQGYITQMNRYSSLGAGAAVSGGKRSFNLTDILLRPGLTFFYNYVCRLGFLDGREGLLLHLYHASYVSWKYAKVWEQSRPQKTL
jgi:glycosyltransferase involved in cell wall biosynthesis